MSLRFPPGLGRNQGWGFRADTSKHVHAHEIAFLGSIGGVSIYMFPNFVIHIFFFFFFEIEGQHANAKAHEAVDHLANRESTAGSRTANLFLEIWVSLHHHEGLSRTPHTYLIRNVIATTINNCHTSSYLHNHNRICLEHIT